MAHSGTFVESEVPGDARCERAADGKPLRAMGVPPPLGTLGLG